MSSLKKALLWAVSVIFVATTSYAGEIGHIPISSNTHTFPHIAELKPAPDSYQLAKMTFLPELTDSETGWGGNSISNSANKGDNCRGYALTSCPANATCSSCPFDRRYKKLISCPSGYTKTETGCKASSCQAIGYRSDIPVNNICTKFNDSGLTCYKDCRSVSCSGYSLNCDTFNIANSSAKATCPDCENANANCSPKLCKVSSCMSGYKIADNGTTCVPLDDNCPTNYYKSCETGTQGDPKYTEKGTACWQCKPPEVQCEAPYYRNSENKCVLWDGVAALARTCSELITTTKNGNITGNILVWGTINCQENEITLAAGQKLVGRAFFNGKYPEATDSSTNKFSKITWNFTSKVGNALTLEHNATLSDLTLEIKSDVKGSWVVPAYKTPILLEVGAKENLIFKNMDLYGDMSAADGKGLTIINATTGKISLQGKNSFRFKNAMKSSDGSTSSYAANSSTYLMIKGNMTIGKDASLDIAYSDGGSYYNFYSTTVNMTDNAVLTFNSSTDSYIKLFEVTGYSGHSSGKLTMSGTSKMTINGSRRLSLAYELPIAMYDSSIINFRGQSIAGSLGSSMTGDALSMNGNSIINADVGSTSTSEALRGQVTLNNNATLRIKSSGIRVYGYGTLTLNNNSKFIVKQNNTLVTDTYYNSNYGVFSSTRGPNMNGSSKFYIEADRHIFEDARFNLSSTTAKIYAKQTNTSYKVFGAGGSNPEVWLYRTVSNAPFYIETPDQNGYNGAEDDGLYLMPTLGVSSTDGASICSHMTGGYSSSKINRDLACWTHGTVNSAVNDPARPNNNDYFKGKQCDRCSTGYRLTGVTHVSKYDSRFTSTKSDFDSEMSALSSAMNF